MANERSITSDWIGVLNGLDDVQRMAPLLTRLWIPPAVVIMRGVLGAGKTTLVQAVGRAWGVQETIKSPTFDLVHIFTLPTFTLYHADLYRLQSEDELDVVDLPAPGTPNTIVMAEWGDALVDRYPDHFVCTLSLGETEDQRILSISAHGMVRARLSEWSSWARNHYDMGVVASKKETTGGL